MAFLIVVELTPQRPPGGGGMGELPRSSRERISDGGTLKT